MMDLLEHHGYTLVDEYTKANLILVNTCNIREKAAEKVYSAIGRYAKHKAEKQKKGESVIIVVAGCVGQAEGEMMRERAPVVDIVLGSQTYHQLPEMLERLRRKDPDAYRVNTQFPLEPKFDFLPKVKARQIGSTSMAIQEGCDKFCTFCCVPYTRGPEYSRPFDVLVQEAKELSQQGIKEISLEGQNVSDYRGKSSCGRKTYSLAQLCREIANIEGIARIRYSSSHPRDITQELADTHRDCAKVMPAFHLPVQSGSNAVLQKMNRQHTRERYLEIFDMFKSAVPHIKFSSDFIVGFPGETEQDFEDTLDLVRKVEFTRSYSFAYSQRPGTPAAVEALQVPEDLKKERLWRLQELLDHYEKTFNESLVGQVVPVLFTRKGRREGQIVGRSCYLQSVYTEASTELFGTIQKVELVSAGVHGMGGKILR